LTTTNNNHEEEESNYAAMVVGSPQIATAAVKKSALAAELYVELAPTSLSESDNLAMVV
jgi:hypothetical protein